MADGRDLVCPQPGCTSQTFEWPTLYHVRGREVREAFNGTRNTVRVLRCTVCLCRFELHANGSVGAVWAHGG